MDKRLVSFFKYAFFLGLGVFLVWWSLQQIPDSEWSKFKEALASAHYLLILPVFLILASSHLIRALRWRILIEPMGYKPALPNTFFAVMIGYLANLAVPRLGEVLKCTILAKYEKIPAQKIVGTIVTERAFDVVCLGIVFLLALIFQFDIVTHSYQQVKKFPAAHPHEAMPLYQIIILIVIGAAILSFIAWVIISKKWKIFIEKMKRIILGVWEGLISAGRLKQKYTFILYSVLIWALYLGGTWIGLYATDGTSGFGVKEAISCLAFASIGMILTPGGIGAYAYLLAKVLEQSGINYTIGYANGTLQWFAQFLLVVVIGFICMGLLPWYNKRKENQYETS